MSEPRHTNGPSQQAAQSPRRELHRGDAGRPAVVFGPALAGIGSWEWIGADLTEELGDSFRVSTFRETIPDCDVAVIVKYKPPLDVVREAASRCAILFCPVDGYASAADIDADYELLRCCSQIVLHTPSLTKYFQSYAPVTLLDHHVKFTAPLPESRIEAGPILWTGMRRNLPPLAEWINQHRLPGELQVLTNLKPGERPSATDFGFHENNEVRIDPWSADRHRAALKTARGAIDIKGDDFRQRHKPPAKALDVLASGVPLAMNSDSSSAAFLRGMGFDLAEPADTDRWLSQTYWEKTQEFGRTIRASLSRRRIGQRLQQVIEEVLQEGMPC